MAKKPTLPADDDEAGEPVAPKKKKGKKQEDIDEDILREARDFMEDVSGRDADNRSRAKEDTEFVYKPGAQWDSAVKARWGDDATLEFNQLVQFVNQVVNDGRQERPGIRVHPAGGKASEKTAEVIQGVARGIENDSQAEAIYDTGLQAAVVGGRGYWRVCSEFESPTSFNQKLKLKPIDDVMSVYLDLDYQEPDGSDRSKALVMETLSEEQFEERFPNASPVSWEPADDNKGWYSDGGKRVVVADYYRRTSTKRTLVRLTDGSTVYDDELPEGAMIAVHEDGPEKGKPISRETDVFKVEWFKIAGGEQILEEYEWPGTIIPVVCCMGDVMMIDGERTYQGIIRRARDPQKMYNYEKSMKARQLGQATMAPYIASERAIQGYELEWKNANKARYSVLPFRDIDEAGNPIPPPTRVDFAPVPTGWVEAAQSDKEDIKSVIGMYQNSLGQHSTETSGKAILAKEKQSDNATFHFMDNLGRAIALTGRIIVEVLGDYYDKQRLVTSLGKDGSREMVELNKPGFATAPDGSIQAIVENDVTTGEYAVTVEAGPSYATAREQSRDALLELVQNDKSGMFMACAPDLIVRELDFPGHEELSERLKLMLPPPIQQHLAMKEKENGKGGPEAAMQEMQQQLTQLQQQLQQMQQQGQELQQENIELKSGVTAKMQAAKLNAQVDEQEMQRKADLAERQALLDAQAAERKAELDARLALTKAHEDNATKIQVAKIGAETDIIIAGLTTPSELSANGEEKPPSKEVALMTQMAAHLAQMSESAGKPRKKRHTPKYDASGNISEVVSTEE